MADVWHHCEIDHYSVVDDFGDHGYTTTRLVWTEYAVVRHTPKGVWLQGFMTGEFFVLGTATRQRAVPTKELALADARQRKLRHIQGCAARLAAAKRDLEVIDRQGDRFAS